MVGRGEKRLLFDPVSRLWLLLGGREKKGEDITWDERKERKYDAAVKSSLPVCCPDST